MKKKSFTYLIYTRCSQEEQAKGYSHPMQIDGIKTHPKAKGGTCVGIYSDSSTGTTFNRKGMNQLLAMVESPSIQVDKIFVWNWDRFGRNTAQSLMILKRIQEQGVDIESIDNNIDFDSPEWILNFSIFAAIAEMESLKISARTKAGVNQAQRSGNYCFSLPPGYKREFIDNKRFKIVWSESAAIVKDCLEQVAAGIPKMDMLKMYRDRLLIKSNSAFYRIFERAKFYAGYYDVPAFKSMPAKEVKGNYEPLISLETYEKLSINPREYTPKQVFESLFFLKGFLKCAEHFTDVTGYLSTSKTGRKYGYYQANRKKGNIMNSDKVHNSIEDLLHKIEMSYDLETRVIIQQEFQKQIDIEQKEINSKKVTINKLRKKITKVENDFIEDKINSENFYLITEKLEAKLAEDEAELHMLLMEFDSNNYCIDELFELCNNLGDLYTESPVNIRIEILRVVFPEGIFMHKVDYGVRTRIINDFIFSMSTNTGFLESVRNEKGGIYNEIPPEYRTKEVSRTHQKLLINLFHKIKSA